MAYNKIIYGGKTLIDLTGDTVTADKLLKDVTAHGKDGEPVTGTCTFDSDTSDATVEAAEMLDGETSYARGVKITGSMPNRSNTDDANGTISTKSGEFTIKQGYHDGSGKVTIASAEQAKIKPENIKAGVTILGETGTYGGEEVTAQTKTVTPQTVEQSITPDDGVDYLSEVVVLAIPYVETDNAAGGKTVTIG